MRAVASLAVLLAGAVWAQDKSARTNDLLRQQEASDHREEAPIESVRMGYTALTGVAATVAKDLGCGGKNVIMYGPNHSDSMLLIRSLYDQLDQLGGRLKEVLEIKIPGAPDQPNPPVGSLYGMTALNRGVMQAVADLIALFRGTSHPGFADAPADESGAIAAIVNAAVAQGCIVYWPDQFSANPMNPNSQVLAKLRAVADLNDNGGIAGKPAGLQQQIRTLRMELRRAEGAIQGLESRAEVEQAKLKLATQKVDALKAHLDWMSNHIEVDKDAASQAKLNRTFTKSWDDLEATVQKQMALGPPRTIEDQNRAAEMLKRVELMRTQTNWLAQYVKDERDLALQDKLKRSFTANWDELEAAVKAQRALAITVPAAVEPIERDQKRWNQYAADLRTAISGFMAATEAHNTFRAALLDASGGTPALSRMLKAEALLDLMFDEKFMERTGTSVVQIKLQKLTGTRGTRIRPDSKDSFSGGVILSFVQYEPNGKMKNSGLYTAYTPFQTP